MAPILVAFFFFVSYFFSRFFTEPFMVSLFVLYLLGLLQDCSVMGFPLSLTRRGSSTGSTGIQDTVTLGILDGMDIH